MHILTTRQIIEAEAAMRPLLQVRGLPVMLQIDLAMLHRELREIVGRFLEEEAEFARECGAKIEGGRAVFPSAEKQAVFERARKTKWEEEHEIDTLHIEENSGIWRETTPAMIGSLVGVIEVGAGI